MKMTMTTFNGTWWTILVWRGYELSEDGTMFCESLPAKINSYGVWEKFFHKSLGMGIWEYPLPNLELMIVSVFIFWQFFEVLFKFSKFPIPKTLSMMLGGLVINLFSYTSPDCFLHQIFYPDDRRPKIAETAGGYGFVIYWFLKGVTIDVTMLKKTEPRAALIGFTTLTVPFLAGYILMMTRKSFGTSTMPEKQYHTIISLQSLSALSGVTALLKDLKINHSEFSRIAQSCAAVTDLLVFIMATVTMLIERKARLTHILVIALAIIVLAYIVWPFMLWIIKQTPEGRPVKEIYIYVVISIAYFVYLFWLTNFHFPTYGVFVIGLAIPAGPPLGTALVEKLECFNVGIFLPLFASLAVVQMDLSWLMKEILGLKNMEGMAYEAISLILMLNVVKFTVTALTAYSVKIRYRDSIVLSLVLLNRSIFEIGYLFTAVEIRLFDNKSYTISTASIFLSSLIIPTAINLTYRPQQILVCYKDRRLRTLKHDSKLKTLLCIHKPYHITSMVNFVESLNPTQDSPLECNVLHLVELMGQANPTFISHQLQKPMVGKSSCSGNIIRAFVKLRRLFSEKVISIDIFTSASLVDHMHEDLCWLILDKSVALVVLPFHRSWSVDRSTIVSDDKAVQNLNRKVLNRATCSIGIYVFRKPLWESQMDGTIYKVCIMYVGGKDDREALALANRMRRNKLTNLTILHLIPQVTATATDQLLHKLNIENLKDIMKNEKDLDDDDGSLKYIVESVKEGAETSMLLRSIANDYDLFIVGRNSGLDSAVTQGLNEWTEFEELGAIGDVIASKDFPSRASLLVLQQQHCE